ncbi:uncharacterized protein LOC112878796 isoform X2 [Panicum hallii]|uniref:uncharacterized protein LOC112878796 isoform X2 n=1 Tax=Panicum hallii TaxID=206008 RepID=UPI000DF4D8BE|nr:uncharacterized protein LOC112878796 isoform X2 [Panicum hallii]
MFTDAQHRDEADIAAARRVADIVRTTQGPVDMAKMISSGDQEQISVSPPPAPKQEISVMGCMAATPNPPSQHRTYTDAMCIDAARRVARMVHASLGPRRLHKDLLLPRNQAQEAVIAADGAAVTIDGSKLMDDAQHRDDDAHEADNSAARRIADIVRTMLGPRGLHKELLPGNQALEAVITADGAAVTIDGSKSMDDGIEVMVWNLSLR